MTDAGVLADLVLALHAALVVFVIAGALAIVLGNRYGMAWVNTRGIRLVHLSVIALIAVQAWLGITCPLTTLEASLRDSTTTSATQASFIGYWLHRLLFYAVPAWVFTLVYTLFALCVLGLWWRYPPRPV
jgi:polyferredoxin